MESLSGLNSVSFTAGYSLGYLASEQLSTPGDVSAIIDFAGLSPAVGWHGAFSNVFGTSVGDFYSTFETKRATDFPPFS